MQSNIQKTTLYFNKDFYLQVKKTALEEGKTVTKLITESVAARIKPKTARNRKQTKGYVFPGFKFGKPFDHRWTREEIYDFI